MRVFAPSSLTHFACAGFEAARQVHSVATDDPRGRLHGHSFRLRAECALPEAWGGVAGGESDALQQAVQQAVAAFNYRSLNDQVAVADDASLLSALADRLSVPVSADLTLDCGPDQGAELKAGQRLAWQRFHFESAHYLPNVPAGHKCGRMHGHGFSAQIFAHDTDLPAIEVAWRPLHAQLNLACLNDLPGLSNPTSEWLSHWIYQHLKDAIAVDRVVVCETASSGSVFDGTQFRIWKQHSLDSAVRLSAAKEDDPRRRIHGHTYSVALHLVGDLDTTLGWVTDFGDVREQFRPLFKQLDHQPLFEIAGLESGCPAMLARWIADGMGHSLPALAAIEVAPQPDRGVRLALRQ
jgi:6-pyruvoyltetrahydropterin/6-carboxytetrahydropterin synthase